MASLVTRQFDVYRNPIVADRGFAPYLVNLQSDLFSDRTSVVVAPLVDVSVLQPTPRLNPVFVIEDRKVMLSIVDLAAAPKRVFKKTIANLEDRRDDFIAAIDLLFTGI
jgi:toxin CcdB